MKSGSRLLLFVVAAALIGSIGLLGTLQYRWLGQVSAAERERMKSTLASWASAFSLDFDREITRAYLTFQLDSRREDANLATLIAERMEQWQATARFPRLLQEIYVVPRAGDVEAALQKFNVATRFLEPVEWPEELIPIRDTFKVSSTSSQPGTTLVVRSMPRTIWADVPAVVVPAPIIILDTTVMTGDAPSPPLREVKVPDLTVMILVMDRDYLAREMLPSLAAQHFSGTEEGTDYEMAVVSTAEKKPVYSTAAGFTPDPDAPGDATADLFQVRQQEFGSMVAEVRRFSTFWATRIERQREEPRTVGGRRVALGETPVSIMLQHSEGNAAGERSLASAAAAAIAARPVGPPWRLIVKHPSGSLEAAVAQVRRRNLMVSSGILGILAISVGFLVLTTRRAQDLARQQMEFVAAVSHELRTPLAVIRSAADNLAEGVVRGDEQVKKYGALVRGEGRRLSEMVEQILELSGIHSGQRGFALAPVRVAPLLREIVSMSSTLIDEAGMRVEYDMPDTLPPVLGDEQALRRVFQNLLGNAIKYGASGGWIGIRARSTGRDVTISIQDRGMGIEVSEQAKIFEPFYRAPGAIAAQIQGAGLGLSLVQRIVEAHGGRITLRSSPGAGSEFTVHLPSASEEGATRTASVPDPARTSA